jgi:putative sterol carrier protein
MRGKTMSLESATAAIRAKAGTVAPLGHTIQFDLGGDGVIFWDGTQAPPLIDNAARDAETTITISLDNLDSLIAGQLNPTMAYMTGKLKIQGSMGVALKMGELLGE